MFPLFTGDDRRQRRMNLGGASAAATHDELMQQAKAIRNERLQQRLRQEAVVTLQRWWRAQLNRKAMREELKERFDSDPSRIDAMRCLVLLKTDEDRLAIWSERTADLGQEHFAGLATGLHRESWIVLMRQVAIQLLRFVACHPDSKHTLPHLKIINALLDWTATDAIMGQNIVSYLLRNDYYLFLKQATERIPVEAKATSTALPLLVPLFTAPFTVSPVDSELYTTSFVQTVQYILTIPLLPNRLPLQSLSQFSARLPLHMIHLIVPVMQELTSTFPLQVRIHLLANLCTFMPPRYKVMKTVQTLEAYLELLTLLVVDLPASVFEAPSADSDVLQSSWIHGDDGDDEDDEDIQPIAGPSSSALPVPQTRPAPAIEVDAKTRARLRTLAASKHVSALLAATGAHPTTRLRLYAFFLALYTAWPTCRPDVLSGVLAGAGGGLVRELYRGHVRGTALVRDDGESGSTQVLADPAHASAWLPLIFLTDLYTQALLTMGDDEFFASRSPAAPSTSAVHRNPLTVDELVSFSRQLLNIAFTLYWSESVTSGGKAPEILISWEGVRDKVTKLLQAIHARDSRRPFTPPDHWLISSQLDMTSFVDAAVYEEQALSTDEDASPSTRHGGRALSKRQLAHLSPRLGVLNNIPFAIPFATRVEIFRQFVVNDMIAYAGSAHRFERATARTRTRVVVRRGNVASDGFDKLANTNLKGLVEITFVDLFGNEEAGIDGGGVFKEFFTSLCKEVFDTDRGLWLATKKNELYPNPHSYAKEPHSLDWYRFIGRILGKALYEGILVDVAFAGFFLAKWLGKQSYLDDLASLDLELYNGLLFLKNYDGNPEDLSLTFAVVEDNFGVAKTIDLIPNGSNTPVTRENRLQYIYLVCHYRLTKQIRPQSEAFFEGLSDMIDPKWIRMFNQQELQILIGGVNSPIDLDDLRSHTNYSGLYSDEEQTVTTFWKVVNSFDHEQRKALLRFATSCSRPPLLGFKELQPNFSIRDAGNDQHRLPTASTCVNLLKLPRYTSERVLREKLLQAITSGAGFDLS
ncbi:HECT-domain-containing protein [Phellopilus nigrolimitatus]|nr:HECT-domain-containing protein [Phellopilus nigrolimitatus]